MEQTQAQGHRIGRGELCVFCSAVLYSIGGLCIKLIPWNGMAINSARTGIALVLIAAYLAAVRHPIRLNRWILLGSLCVFGTNALYSVANKLTAAANVIVLQFTAPIFVVIFTMIFFRQKPKKLDLMACAVVFFGIALCFLGSLEGGQMLGNVLALLSGATYAVVFMMNRLPDGDPISSVFWGDLMSFLTGLPFLLRETDFSGVVVLNLLILGLFQVGLAYILLCIGLRTVNPVASSLISGIEPVLNPIWVAVFYGETIGPMGILGAILVVGGVLSYNLLKLKQERNG